VSLLRFVRARTADRRAGLHQVNTVKRRGWDGHTRGREGWGKAAPQIATTKLGGKCAKGGETEIGLLDIVKLIEEAEAAQ
jgi:hypothetical protein